VLALAAAIVAAIPVRPARAAAGTTADRDGLLLEYRFEGQLEDTSGGNHRGKLAGTPVFVPGHEGQCLSLDGTGAFVDSGTNLPSLKDTFTIECWVKPAANQRPYADVYGNHQNEFTGCALQQNGEQTNRYYFTFGTGTAWVYSRTFALVPDKWQHVAVVKTAKRLRIYVDGMPTDNQSVDQPMATSTTNFMVGLGIAGQPRWFNGQVDELRVWDRERTFKSLLPEAEQVEHFVSAATLDRTSSSRWNLFPCQPGNKVTFGLDQERVPASVETITLAFDCRDARGREVPFSPPVSLRRADGFEASVVIPPRPGYGRLAYQPSIQVAGRSRSLTPGVFSFLVLEPQAAARATRAADGVIQPSADMPDAFTPSQVLPLDGEWLLATDPQNVGREQQWWKGPVAEAKAAKVPWIIQDAFPGYHGVAWYWRECQVPANPHAQGRYLLRFWAVDYKADVWVNGAPAGSHEGGETPFVLDVTEHIHPKRGTGPICRNGPEGASHKLDLSPFSVAVRVLNPTHQAIDGMTLHQTPRRAKVIPYSAGASYNHGGIVDSVELLVVPQVYLEDLYLRPEPETGVIRVQAAVRSTAAGPVRVRLHLSVAPAASGETLDAVSLERELPAGDTTVETDLRVGQPRLWNLHDPYLYRVTARVSASGSKSCDERSSRCGFRDFRFANGYFRLNGRRLFLRSAHTVNATPVGQQVPHDPDLFRRDLLYMKTMGFNCIRFIWGGATRAQLDLCDELGLLVYAESAAAQPLENTPSMPERFDRAVAEMVRRDRNHPSVVVWGLLNESHDGPVFRHATEMLPLVRSSDETRVVALNSGRWDGQLDIGSFCNPGATGWDGYLGGEGPAGPRSHMTSPGGYCARMGDVHAYPRVPHTAETIRFLRTLGQDTGNVFLSEYGIGSAVDLWRVTRQFEQLGKPDAEDALFYRDKLDRFLADWQRWRLEECFATPAEFFAQSLRKMAGQRTLGLNAIRANPRIVGHNVTGMMDHVNCGEGLFTLFRELKPGTVDAMFEAFAPLRVCLFAEPANLTRGGRVRLEGVLANEDALPPGDYSVRLQVVGPGSTRLLDRTVPVTVPARQPEAEPPFALPFFADELVVDGPPGRYRFLAAFERGGAPTGGETEFYVADPAGLPPIKTEVILWGDDPDLARWLNTRGVRTRPAAAEPAKNSALAPVLRGEGPSSKGRSHSSAVPKDREVILVVGKPPAGGAVPWRELAGRIARGATAVFLSPAVFRERDNPVAWLPLPRKGMLTPIHGWLYLKDEWAKTHPVFDGLPVGGLLDYTFYREIIPDLVFAGQDPPQEAVAGAIKASQDYASGLMVSVHALGAGRFVLNTLLIRENLGRHPAADRLLCNLLNYAAADAGKPLAGLPADFDQQLKSLGY
jgi:hypothetical protein